MIVGPPGTRDSVSVWEPPVAHSDIKMPASELGANNWSLEVFRLRDAVEIKRPMFYDVTTVISLSL